MKFQILATLSILVFASCASRTTYSPTGPTTVGMPEKLSDRERSFMPEIDSALRSEGLIPVKHGKGDLQLGFEMSSGPINIATRIELMEDKAVLLTANGRSGGVPLIGRENIARKSFDEAFAEFQSGLSSAASNRGWSSSSARPQGSTPSFSGDQLPVY